MTAQERIEAAEWERRFKARVVSRLMDGKTTWTQKQADRAAEHEYQQAEHDPSYENDPEGSADEALSYWGDGA
jgi:hypothetical protein